MHAIVRQSPELPGAGLLSIAGRPLIARQIQWFRTIGCDAIAVEIGPGTEGFEIARWLRDEDALGAGVSLVLAGSPLDPREIAARAGFSADAPLLVLAADVIAGGGLGEDLAAARGRGARVRLEPPVDLGGRLRGARLDLVPAGQADPILVEPFGWGVRLRSRADAMTLEAAILDGRLAPRPDDPAWGIQVHAAETSPGIWIGRGALVEEGATLIAPVLIEAGAVVCAGATVGPRVCLERRAVVSAGAQLHDVVVSAGTIVGEGIALSHVLVEPFGLRDLASDDLIEVGDRLVLDQRDHRPKGGLMARVLAAVVFVLLLPAALLRLATTRSRGVSLRRR